MTDAELLFNWISGKRRLSLSEQMYLCGKGFCILKHQTTVVIPTQKGITETQKPRRRFRPMGAPATNTEILFGIAGGAVSINNELTMQLYREGLVTQNSLTSHLEITNHGRAEMLREFPIKEIRGLYGSELII